MDERPLFSLVNVSRSYTDVDGREIRVLQNANARISGRGVTALIGPSGQGKSTLLNLLGGLDTDYTGQLSCQLKPVPRDGAALRDYRGRFVSYVFQELNLVSHLTAAENVALPLLCRGRPRQAAIGTAVKMLASFGLVEVAGRRPGQLSGGQKQRVAIARAVVSDSAVILADEPTGSLDPDNAERVMAAFRTLSRVHRRPSVVVTHNVNLALRYADRVLRIDGGTIHDVTPPRRKRLLVLGQKDSASESSPPRRVIRELTLETNATE